MAFKMKGHTLPGINQKGKKGVAEGQADSAAFQKSPFKNYKKGYYGEGSAFNHPEHADHHGATKEQEEEYEKNQVGYVPGETRPSKEVDRSGAL
mgnify:CR=1 FL=1|tara:strand:+ start:3305 stop:3586 length:282 start_codon:yes stop_codon:yes gene_type:complete